MIISLKDFTGNPRVSIILVAHNLPEMTIACIRSIYRYSIVVPFEILVMDNGSDPGFVEQLRKAFPRKRNLKIHSLHENLGFGPAVNLGIKQSSGEYLMLLNNDTLVTPGWLDNLVAVLDKDQQTGIVSPVTNHVGEGPQLEEGLWNLEADIALIEKYAREISDRREIIYEPSRLVFFCVLLRKSLITGTGYLDENFITGNYEDDDFCMRCIMAGYKLAVARNVLVYHYGNSTFNIIKADYQDLMERNSILFYQKAALLSGNKFPPIKLSECNVEISVIIRTKNRSQLLCRALNSLTNQTCKNFEVIVVNDGGEDVSELLESYSDYLKVVYIGNEISSGRTSAMNAGLGKISGNWITYLDDDDLVYPWHLETLWKETNNGKSKVVVYAGYLIALYNSSMEPVPEKIKVAPYFEFNRDKFLIQNYIPVHTYLHPAEAISRLGLWNEELDRLEDYEFLLRLNQIFDFKGIRKITCAYNIYPDVTNSIFEGREKYLESLHKVYSLHETHNPEILNKRMEAIAYLQKQNREIEEIRLQPVVNEMDRISIHRKIINLTWEI